MPDRLEAPEEEVPMEVAREERKEERKRDQRREERKEIIDFSITELEEAVKAARSRINEFNLKVIHGDEVTAAEAAMFQACKASEADLEELLKKKKSEPLRTIPFSLEKKLKPITKEHIAMHEMLNKIRFEDMDRDQRFQWRRSRLLLAYPYHLVKDLLKLI